MKLHADGTLEGTPEEIAQYQKLQNEQFREWAKQWDNRQPHYFFYPQITCGSSARELGDAISNLLAKHKFTAGGAF